MQQYGPMTLIKFSVLMSVYNKEDPEHLRAAFLSLLNQELLASQVLLVCDGPLTLQLDKVIAEFETLLPLTIVRTPANNGLASALNLGLAHCEHEWVARFDTDDICEPHRLRVQAEYIKGNPDVDVFGSAILEFASDPANPYAQRSVPETHEKIVIYAKKRCPLNHMTVVYRRTAVESAGGYPIDNGYEDYGLWVKLILLGYRFGNLPEALVRVRAGPSLSSRRGGWRYLRAEVSAQWRYRAMGFLSIPQFLQNVTVRTAVRVAPARVRNWAYRSLLRRVAH